MREFFAKLESRMGVRPTPSADDARRLAHARDFFRRLRWIPGLLMVGVGNSVAMYASHDDSDIDLFVVAKTGRLWLVRALVTFVVALGRSRKTAERHRDMLCLSFFVDEEWMGLGRLAIENDVYLAYWVATLKPVFDPYGTYGRFLSANEDWIRITPEELVRNKSWLPEAPDSEYRERFGGIWNGLDHLAKSLLLPRTLRHYEKLGRPWGVRVEEHVLKFHDDDARARVRDAVMRQD